MNFFEKLFASRSKLLENLDRKEYLSKEKDIEWQLEKIIALKDLSQKVSEIEKLIASVSGSYNVIIEIVEKLYKRNPQQIIIRILIATLIIDSIERKRSFNAQYIIDKEDTKNLEYAVKIHEETQAMSPPELLYDKIMRSCVKASRMLSWSQDKIDLFAIESAHRKILGATYFKIINGDID